jgi:hypothetical protein
VFLSTTTPTWTSGGGAKKTTNNSGIKTVYWVTLLPWRTGTTPDKSSTSSIGRSLESRKLTPLLTRTASPLIKSRIKYACGHLTCWNISLRKSKKI